MSTLTGLSISECRRHCGSDFRLFLQLNAREKGFTTHEIQYIMADFLQGRSAKWREAVKVILGFRYCTKSWTLRQYIKWRWLRCPQMQVIVHSSTDRLAKRATQAVLVTLREDPLIKHLAPDHDVGEYAFDLKGISHEMGWSIQSAGIKTSLTGSRCDLYAFDDPEPDDEPEALHDRIIKAFEQAKFILHPSSRHLDHFRNITSDNSLEVVPIPEQTQMIVMGQPHWEETAYVPPPPGLYEDDDDTRHPLTGANFLRIPAVSKKTGWWLWEDKYFSPKHKRILTPDEVSSGFTRRTWRQQMAIDPTPLDVEGAVLKISHIQRVHRWPTNPVMFVDTADSETGCEWGLVIGGLIGAQVHIMEMTGFKGESYEGEIADGSIGESSWAKCFNLAQELGCKAIYLEKNLKAARMACRRFISKIRVKCSVYEYTARGAKHKRIIDCLEQPVNNKVVTAEPHIFFDRKNLKQLAGLRYSFLPLPNDRIDAVAALVAHFVEMPGLASITDANANIGPNIKPVRSRFYNRLTPERSIFQRSA